MAEPKITDGVAPSADGLLAAAARVDLQTEPGLPGPGLRLWGEPFQGQETPLTVGAAVLTRGGRTAVVIAADLLFFPDDLAARIRDRVATLAFTGRELLLLNASHDPAVPPLPNTPYEGDAAAVARFGREVERAIEAVVRTALAGRRPARL